MGISAAMTQCDAMELIVDAMEWTIEGLAVSITVTAVLGLAGERALLRVAADVTEYAVMKLTTGVLE